jgi:peptidoglycan/xylan/chitin deacetylase (PgdA/CDA1 family)
VIDLLSRVMRPSENYRDRLLASVLFVGVTISLVLALFVWDASKQPSVLSGQTINHQTPTASTTNAPARIEWTGPVEHIFFHPLVRRPDLAFAPTTLGKGYRDYFVTVEEFARILDQLHLNNWVLVNMHEAVNGQLRIPIGKQPLVISIDDLNFYQYMRDNGGSWRLAIDESRVRLEVHDPTTGVVSFTDEEIVPMLDQFVLKHPDFSLDNAKGVIGLTGYQGALGERLEGDSAAQFRATAVARQLSDTGWLFASHSYGHIALTKRSESQIRVDAAKWKKWIEPVVGPTDIFIYPYGEAPRPKSAKIALLREEFGFTIFCEIDQHVVIEHREGWARFPRRHIDGIAFSDQADNLAPFFDVPSVIDSESRANP